jgi:hypothetical protein
LFGLAVVLRLFHAGNVTSCPGKESGMLTVALITAVFAEVDAQRSALPTHPEAPLCAQPHIVVDLRGGVEQGVLEIVERRVVELKGSLERAAGQAPSALKPGDGVVENLLKGHG